jgi:hypothetical protein
VSRNPVLQQLGHLPALASVGGNLTLWRNDQLTAPSIGGASRFVALAQLGGSLVVEDRQPAAQRADRAGAPGRRRARRLRGAQPQARDAANGLSAQRWRRSAGTCSSSRYFQGVVVRS